MIDSYSLSKINSTSSSNSTTSSSGHSASLPMPLGPTSTSKTSLLTSSQLETIEKLILLIEQSWGIVGVHKNILIQLNIFH